MKAPRFWYDSEKSWAATLLQPVSRLYGQIVQEKITETMPYESALPVICVGNIVMGGSGKTPVVQALAHMLQQQGKNPAVLLRGYGGDEKNTIRVGAEATAKSAGDEALLHALTAPTIVSADRVAGAKKIEEDMTLTHIIMDDGLQNPSLKKDLSLIVLDGENPFGNGQVFPAGPLRETLDDAVKRVQGVVIIGKDAQNLATQLQFLLPVFKASLKPKNADDLRDKAYVAFAGIGRPEKFFTTLRDEKIDLIETVPFADHYPYTARELKKLAAQGPLLTTRKDWVRLPREWQERVAVLDVTCMVENPADLVALLKEKTVL